MRPLIKAPTSQMNAPQPAVSASRVRAQQHAEDRGRPQLGCDRVPSGTLADRNGHPDAAENPACGVEPRDHRASPRPLRVCRRPLTTSATPMPTIGPVIRGPTIGGTIGMPTTPPTMRVSPMAIRSMAVTGHHLFAAPARCRHSGPTHGRVPELGRPLTASTPGRTVQSTAPGRDWRAAPGARCGARKLPARRPTWDRDVRPPTRHRRHPNHRSRAIHR